MSIFEKNQNKFFFSNELTSEIKKNLLKHKNLSYIYIPANNNNNLEETRKFCKKHKINFYISNNITLFQKYKADGFHISSNNRGRILKFTKPKMIIGTCHNQIEYFNKIQQNCKLIFLSPIFFNPKYSINKILGVLKFNMIKLNWQSKVLALGGISGENLKKVINLKLNGFGFIRYIKKAPLTKK